MQCDSQSKECYNLSAAQTAPREVLMKIFEQLKLSDRLATRLVCRKWYEVCRDRRFHAQEKFSVEKFYINHLNNVLNFFTTVDRELLNFEFNALSFTTDSFNFWKVCGPRIHSLQFTECELSLLTFFHIVTNCTNLQQLTIRVYNIKFFDFVNERDNPTRELNLQSIVEDGHINTTVQSVELHFRGYKHQWGRWLVQLFQLFPNIKRFAFFGSEFTWDYEVMDPACLAAINETLFRSTVEDLRLVTYSYQYREFDWIVLASKSHLTMLTEVAIHVNDNTDKDLLASFLGRQRNLRALHFLLRSIYPHPELMDSAFEIIFNQCHKINTLELTSVRRLSWGTKWFQFLAKSSITSLRIESNDIVFPDLKEYPPNSTIQQLFVLVKSYFNSSTLPLIEAFTNLKTLKLVKITNEIMRSVLQRQKHLTVFGARFRASLISKGLRFNSSKTDEEEGRPLDFSEFHVERLSIPADLAKRSDFLSSSLKYLHLYPPAGEVYYNPISLDTEISPLLEEVIIETSCFSYPFEGTFTDNILRFIRPLKKLRYLYLTARTRLVYSSDMPYLDDDFVQSLFQHCQSLRCFIYKRIYFRNNLDRRTLTVAELDERLSRISSSLKYKNMYLPSVQGIVHL